jgi:hypothetical protein
VAPTRTIAPATNPLVTTIGLAIVWALPLAWWACIAGAAAFVGLPSVAIVHRLRERDPPLRLLTATAGVCAVSLVGLITVGYAALALTGAARFGPVSRVGHPFLVATGLRVPGGAGLLALCAVVSLIPRLFPDDDRPAAM